MNVQVSTRVPEEIKAEVDNYAKEIGLDIPTILRMAMYYVAKEHDLPSKVNTLKSETYKSKYSPKQRNEIVGKWRNSPKVEKVHFRLGKQGALIPIGKISQEMKEWIKNG